MSWHVYELLCETCGSTRHRHRGAFTVCLGCGRFESKRASPAQYALETPERLRLERVVEDAGDIPLRRNRLQIALPTPLATWLADTRPATAIHIKTDELDVPPDPGDPRPRES